LEEFAETVKEARKLVKEKAESSLPPGTPYVFRVLALSLLDEQKGQTDGGPIIGREFMLSDMTGEPSHPQYPVCRHPLRGHVACIHDSGPCTSGTAMSSAPQAG
jgi:hypothetical protein